MDWFTQIGQQLADSWQAWPRGKRISLVVSTLVAVGAFAALANWGSRTNYATLLSGLSAEDASAIVERLGADKIPYELGAGGSMIRVPAEQVHELRLRLAGDGLPRGGGAGFELFDEPAFGLSRFAEELNYRRGLEGELSRTIRSLDVVREARVHIVMPKKSLFQEQQAAASASVSLRLQPGRKLSKGQVQSVVHMVSSSVESLPPDRVTVVDTSGEILSKSDSGATGQLASELEHQRQVEGGLEQRVRQILGRVVGPEAVTVRVTADIDFSKSELTLESFDPDTVAVRSEKSVEEDRGSASGAGGEFGIPGARSNLSGTGGQPNSKQNTRKRTSTKNYEVSKELKRHSSGARKLEKISVAVLVDGTYEAGEGGAQTFVERSPEAIERLTMLAKTAVGFDAVRGDQVVVQSMAFRDADAAEVVPPAPWVEIVKNTWRPAIAVVLVCILLFILLMGRRAVKSSVVLDKPRTVRELEAVIATNLPSFELPEHDGPTGLQLASVRPEPAKAAAVLKTWLGES